MTSSPPPAEPRDCAYNGRPVRDVPSGTGQGVEEQLVWVPIETFSRALQRLLDLAETLDPASAFMQEFSATRRRHRPPTTAPPEREVTIRDMHIEVQKVAATATASALTCSQLQVNT